MIKIIETPRDGFQGLKQFIPTKVKIDYINQLLQVGFDTVEVGSFVSTKAIPQMMDTAEVIQGLQPSGTSTRIMVLVGNLKGAKEAMKYDVIDDILFPFSVSESFLKKNLNTDFIKAKQLISEFVELCDKNGKRLIVYLTMGFGNPYGDSWSVQVNIDHAGYLYELGLKIIPLSDIMGNANPDIISSVFISLYKAFPDIEFGAHLHVSHDAWHEKVDAAYEAGVRRFDSVLGGFGGCPMADDVLVGNLNTLDLINYLENKSALPDINGNELEKALNLSEKTLNL